MFDFSIVDTHIHIWKLSVTASYPNRNISHSQFPHHEKTPAIYCDVGPAEMERQLNANNVGCAVFVQVYNDCPEETEWVIDNAPNGRIAAVVAGVDPSKIDTFSAHLERIKTKAEENGKTRLAGIRHIVAYEEKDYYKR